MTGFVSKGGVGPPTVDYRPGELEDAAAALDRAGDLLGEVGDVLRSADGAAVRIAPPERVLFADGAAGLERAQLLGGSLRGRTAAMARSVRAAGSAYEAAEAGILHSSQMLRGETEAMLVNYALESPGPYPSTRLVEDLVNHSPVVAAELLMALFVGPGAALPARLLARGAGWLRDREHGGLSERSVYQRVAPALAELVDASGTGMIGPLAVAEVAEVPGAQPVTGTLAGMLEFQAGLKRDDVPDSNILISSTPTASGTVHVVAFPGTQIAGDGEAGRNFADAGGAVEAAGADSEYVVEATLEALERVGAERGDRLVLTGHSQGGMHAANAAASAQIRGVYDVEYVVTAGSPVGETAIPADVRSIHLEHVHDPVPGLDGTPNASSATRVTVYGDGYVPGVDPSEPAGVFGPAHAFENYRHLAAGATAADDPAVRRAEAGLGALLAPTGAATLHRAHLRRRKAQQPPVRTVDQLVERLSEDRSGRRRGRHAAAG
ncbi:hypothetical protein [Zhihengliuella salsuginis]|nr:hypothetical protein [Zhihengliuella salsuginis]